jgi:hypothetical protein
MARIKNNPLVMGASGKVAGDIVYKTYYDKTVISKVPDMSKRVLSEKQKVWNERMVDANDYAQSFYTSEEDKIKARIRLKLPPHKSLYHALIKEWMEKCKTGTEEELARNRINTDMNS